MSENRERSRGSLLMQPLQKEFKHLFLENQTLSIVGAPFCDGQNLDGGDLAPKALCDAGLEKLVGKLGWTTTQINHVDMKAEPGHEPIRASIKKYHEWKATGGREPFSTWLAQNSRLEDGRSPVCSPKSRTLDAAYDMVENSEIVGQQLYVLYKEICTATALGDFVLTLGGDHSVAAASIAGLCDTKYNDMAVIWVDAHADANTPETSPSLHYHGMPAAHLLGWFAKNPKGFEWFSEQPILREERFAFIGLRDIDPLEGQLLKNSGIHVYTMRDVDRKGIGQVIGEALNKIDPNGIRPLHLSLDVDAVDPLFAPGTGTLARGGLTYREVHYIAEEMAMTNRLVSMDLVEVNPLLDPTVAVTNPGTDHAAGPLHGDDPDMNPNSTPTVQLGVEIILSALGKTILG